MGEEKPELNYDDALENGPIEERGCTDFFCCILFLLFWACTGFIAVTCFANGSLSKVMRPVDYSGNQCGYGTAKDHKFLYFGSLEKSIITLSFIEATVCIKECPTKLKQVVDCHPNSAYKNCADLKDGSYPTFLMFERYCLPTSTTLIAKVSEKFSGVNIEAFLESIGSAKKLILASILLSFLTAYLFSFLLEKCAIVIVGITIIGYFLGIAFLTFKAYQKKNEYAEIFKKDAKKTDAQKSMKIFKILFWVGVTVLAISACLMLCFFGRLILAVMIIKAAADFVTDVKRVVLVPLLTVVVFVFYMAFAILVAAYIFSTGELHHDKSYPYMKIKIEKKEKYYMLFHAFGILWNVALLMMMSNFVITGATCIWYHNNQEDGKHPVSRPIWWMFRYHLGTISFGAIILAIVWVLRIIAEYVHNKAKETDASQAVKFIACCLRCVLACAERFIKFFNKHAFAEVAMRGTGFCTSAAEAMKVVVCNVLRFGMLHGLGTLVMGFAKMFITSTVVVASYFVLVRVYGVEADDYKEGIKNMGGPIFIIFVIAYTVSNLFAHIWETSADVILHCYCIDDHIQGKKGGKSKYASPKLKQALKRARQHKKRRVSKPTTSESDTDDLDDEFL